MYFSLFIQNLGMFIILLGVRNDEIEININESTKQNSHSNVKQMSLLFCFCPESDTHKNHFMQRDPARTHNAS